MVTTKKSSWRRTEELAPIRLSKTERSVLVQKARAAGCSIAEFVRRAIKHADANELRY